MILKINALDTLFFRDGKPFSMGYDSFAQGVFPPSPSAIYGALRSAYLASDMKRFTALETEGDTSKNLIISGFFYSEEIKKWDEEAKNTLFLPMPLDLVKLKEDKEGKKWFCSEDLLKKNKDFYSNTKQNYIIHFDENVEGGDRIINISNFLKYLRGETQNLQTKSLHELIGSEVKVGNGLKNDTRTTEEGKLYRLTMNRLEKVTSKLKTTLSIVVETNLSELDKRFEKGEFLMKLGAEGKIVKSQGILQETSFPQSTDLGKYFKLYFSTPIVFENGWLPDVFDLQTGIGTWNGIKLQLLSAFVGKYISIGGFDLKENKPKKMFKAVPAGSVYYFKVLDESNEKQILEKFDHKNLDSDKIRSKEGFGFAYVSKLKLNENDN
jgi:CRISPR-associated protein Cmr3